MTQIVLSKTQQTQQVLSLVFSLGYQSCDSVASMPPNLAPLLIIIGLILYFFADVPKSSGRTGSKLVRVGEIMFFAGLLATLLLRLH